MDRINSVNTGLNAAGKRIRVPANAATGQAGTTGSSAYENDLQEEIIGGLIEQAGLKGTQVGGAEVSDRHANFIVAHPGARSADILQLIDRIRQRVWQQFGYELELQIQVW